MHIDPTHARRVWKKGGSIYISPTSHGTWTVVGRFGYPKFRENRKHGITSVRELKREINLMLDWVSSQGW